LLPDKYQVMRFLFTVFVIFSFNVSNAQSNIKLDDISSHIGDSVTVCGKVAGMRYFEKSKNQPTFLNIGASYPDQKVTVVIWGDTRKLFTTNIEDLKDKEICITGRIILYKEKAEIIIYNPAQISIQ